MCTVWNGATMSHSFMWIMEISLNFLPFNIILSCGKRKKSHSTESAKYRGYGMVVTMFVGRNSWTKQSEQEQCHMGETKSWIPLCRPFSRTFSCRYQRCQYINVGIHFVLEQIHNTQFCGSKTTAAAATSKMIKMTALLFTFVQTCLAFFSHGDECPLHSWSLLLGFWVILLNTCLITYDHLQMFWTSLKSLLKALVYADMILLLLFTWQVEQNWLPIWHVFRLSFEMLQMKFQTCKELHRQWFFCFQEKVPSLKLDFHLFCPPMKHMTSSTISDLGNSTQNFD